MLDGYKGTSLMPFRCFRTLCVVALWLSFSVMARATHAQPRHAALVLIDNGTPNCGSMQIASLTISDTQIGAPFLTLVSCDPTDEDFTWGIDVQTALGCPPDRTVFRSFGGEGKPAENDTTCRPILRRQGSQISGRLDIPPIQAFLRNNHFRSLSIHILAPNYEVVHCETSGGRESEVDSQKHACAFTLDGNTNFPPAILYSFAFDRAYVVRVAFILGFLLLILIGVTFWFWHDAQQR